MNDTTKMVTKDGLVRVTLERFQIVVEELPRKPVQKQLRAWRIHTGWQVTTMHRDEYIPENLMRDAKLDLERDSFDAVTTKLEAALGRADETVIAREKPAAALLASFERVHPVRGTQFYLKVTPENATPIEVQLKDSVLRCAWDKFECWSPESTMRYAGDGEPHYSMIESTSEGAARKLYKMVQDEKVRAELATLSWGSLSVWDWLRSHKISFDVHHSQWT